jgi:hypothetical protein
MYQYQKGEEEESDTHVMDTGWRTERNAINRENREEYVSVSGRRRKGKSYARDGYRVENRKECDK